MNNEHNRMKKSVDTVLGLPFNIASYAILLMIISKITNKVPRNLVGFLGDTHIYKNHLTSEFYEMLKNKPYDLPTLTISEVTSLEDIVKLTPDDFVLSNYQYYKPIKFDMAI